MSCTARDESDSQSRRILQPYTQRFIVHVSQSFNPDDAFGYPSCIKLKSVLSPHNGWHEYVPRNLALLSESESGRVYCSCCGRELKRKYKFSPSWRFCPRCGAEVLR